ncbi:hypothetical protein RDMS_00580 [Deinococcus sp. RL]|uniref:hypothetical protein n=1 Tax=Deinococcus sp. RL TaxID=1489678 RepID=UPI0004D4D95A|nr:hypothetical protein [Deinococcus sp. RL]KEF35697.1 hypothetical protein RDMS_00580 [Deinococcus sp. RL]
MTSAFRSGPEQFGLTLLLGGRFAGTQEWTLHPERGALVARVQTDFGGVLPELRRVQHSRMHPRLLTSQHYAEGDGRGGRASFETTFDRRNGLVTLRQGRDEASKPLTTEHHDPVSLLVWLRGLEGTERATVQMAGGHVLVQRLADTAVGETPARAYLLRPGGAYVFVETAPPHRLLRLVQPTDFGPLEALADPPRKPSPDRRRRRAG